MNDMSDMINMTEIMEIMDNDKHLVKECFDDFIEEYPKLLLKIKNAIDAGNTAELNSTAHKIKGSLKYLAAKPAADIALKLETMAKNGDLKNAISELDNLEDACNVLKDIMVQYEV